MGWEHFGKDQLSSSLLPPLCSFQLWGCTGECRSDGKEVRTRLLLVQDQLSAASVTRHRVRAWTGRNPLLLWEVTGSHGQAGGDPHTAVFLPGAAGGP